MILFELTGTEDNPVYKNVALQNSIRQLHFLETMVNAAVGIQRPVLSQTLIKALNFHAIGCLHAYAGDYRPCPVTVGNYDPPAHYRVPALMEDFVNFVNLNWLRADRFTLAAYVLWRLNNIHPFINGNGRTARACCYFFLCVRSGGWITGNPVLPVLLEQNRDSYVDALKNCDEGFRNGQSPDVYLSSLAGLIQHFLYRQVN